MRILAFDCCADWLVAGVGEVRDGDVVMLAELPPSSANGHAERLVPAIERVMAEADVVWSGLDALAVTNGPGSFTGIRTCVAAARGLALAARIPVFAMSTLEAFAAARCMAGGRENGQAALPLRAFPLRMTMAGRRGRVFMQDFRDRFEPLTVPRSVEAGEGGPLPGDDMPTIDCAGGEIGAKAMIELAGYRIAAGIVPIEAFHLQPLYLNPPDARLSAGQSLLGKKA